MLLVCFAFQTRAAVAEDASHAEQQSAATGAIFFNWEANIWVINSDGSGLKQLFHFNPQEVHSSPSLSPNGNRIAYVNHRRLPGSPLLHPNVWDMNTDGSEITPLTGEQKRIFNTLAWSPDGRKLAAVSTLTDFDKHQQIKYLTSDIFQVNADGAGAKPLIHFPDPGIHVQDVAWSPDSRKIAFSWTRDGEDDQKRKGINYNIWVMDADGSHVIPLTRFTGITPWIWEIGWSPDSRRVTYTSNRALDGSDAGGRGFNIWVSNADGSGSLPLTRFRNVSCNHFSWSPDGSRLSFSSNDSLDGSDTGKGTVNLWVMKADGTSPVPLTRETAVGLRNDLPAWSPDGSLIAFVSCIGANKPCKLWIMNGDGAAARQLTEQNSAWFQWRQ
jgi:Tol biopolymer transport system component